MEQESSDKELIRATGAAVTKSILYICLVVAAVSWFQSCKLEREIIKQCKDSCTSSSTHMESVTTRECVCGSKKDSLMVMPR